MKIIPLIITTFLFISCQEEEVIVHDINPLLRVYVNNFYKEASVRGYCLKRLNLIISTRPNLIADNNWLGICYRYRTRAEIFLDESLVLSQNHTSIEWVMFHELGHGLLNREHSTNLNSIMNVEISRRSLDVDIRKQFIDELFSNK